MQCKICQHPAYELTKAKVLERHWVQYYACEQCGFIFTQEPFWLPEAYSETINRSDLGLVDRNIRISYALMPVLKTLFNPKGRFLDYGGGYGLMVRIMRDRGFDFFRYDQYCENIFAKGFDVTGEDPDHYELITAIEVFEHLVDPISEIQTMMKFSKNIFFATEILPPGAPSMPGQWSYFGLEHGQHVSLFTLKSLEILAQRLGLHFVTDGRGLHLFSEKPVSGVLFRWLASARIGKYLLPLIKQPSLLQKDYFQVTGHEF